MTTTVFIIQQNEYIIEQPSPRPTSLWTISVALALTICILGCLLGSLVIYTGMGTVIQGYHLALWPTCIGLGIAVGTLIGDMEVWL